MLRNCFLAAIAFFLVSTVTLADIGFDRIVVNATGRCWRIINRDLQDVNHWHSGVIFQVVGVNGTGQTGDTISYELTLKEDYYKGQGWDETKTRIYTGTGVVTSIQNGRVNFEFSVDLGDGNPPVVVAGYYHPGFSSSDHDDRLVINIPPSITNVEDPCDSIQFAEGGISF